MSNPPKRTVLVLGGVRSGKSRFAAKLAEEITNGEPVLFVATAQRSGDDSGMNDRIERHRADRPQHWNTVEEPLNLHEAISATGQEPVVIVDCLTIWLSNLLARCGEPGAPDFSAEAERTVLPALDSIAGAISGAHRPTILVANDVGSGVSPTTHLGNVFADMHGMMNQRVAAVCGEVYLMTAGIELRIK